MNTKIKISNYQLFCLLIGFMTGSTLIFTPATPAKQDGWLAFIVGGVLGTVLISVYLGIARINEGSTLMEIINKCFGKYLGKVICVLYIWYFIHLASLVLRNFAEFSITTSYTETPLLFIVACFTIVAAFAVRKGIEVMGRISEVFIVILTLVVVIVFAALVTEYDTENLKPFMSEGIMPIIKSSFSVMSFPYGETVAFLMVFPYVNNQNKVVKATFFSLIFVGIILLSIVLRNIMVLGPDMVTRDVFPSHVVFRVIPGLDVEPLLDINMILTGIIKSSICIWGAASGISQIMGLKNYKPFVLSVSALIVAISVWSYSSLMEMTQWATEIWPIYSIPFQVIIPIILLVISAYKNNQSKIKRIKK